MPDETTDNCHMHVANCDNLVNVLVDFYWSVSKTISNNKFYFYVQLRENQVRE